jgi:DNA-binding transcriptional regulator LsrR (DeoR family)
MTDDQIRAIRSAYAAGESQQAIADRTGFSQTSVSRVVRKVRYAHIMHPGED